MTKYLTLFFMTSALWLGGLVSCEGWENRLLPAKKLSADELQQAAKRVCQPGQKLKPILEEDLAKVEWPRRRLEYQLPKAKLFYFEKGHSRCALEENFSDQGFIVIPGINDREYTSISISNGCIENGVLYRTSDYDHYDAVVIYLELEKFQDGSQGESKAQDRIQIHTHDRVDPSYLRSVSGLTLLACVNESPSSMDERE